MQADGLTDKLTALIERSQITIADQNLGSPKNHGY
jgi:hypothetical protein